MCRGSRPVRVGRTVSTDMWFKADAPTHAAMRLRSAEVDLSGSVVRLWSDRSGQASVSWRKVQDFWDRSLIALLLHRVNQQSGLVGQASKWNPRRCPASLR